MRHLFLDANIVIDIAFNRPEYQYVKNLIEIGDINLYISPLSIHIAAYTMRSLPSSLVIERLNKVVSFMSVIPLTNTQIQKAFETEYKDFEDMLQFFSAVEFCDTILTGDKKDFENIRRLTKSKINIISPK